MKDEVLDAYSAALSRGDGSHTQLFPALVRESVANLAEMKAKWPPVTEAPLHGEVIEPDPVLERLRAHNEFNRGRHFEGDYYDELAAAARREIEKLHAVLAPLLDHYLHCYDGNLDELALKAKALLR